MAKFESDTGELVRVTGQLVNGKRTGSYAEVQFFGGEVMLTVKDINPGTSPQNTILDATEARQLAGALLNHADLRDNEVKNPRGTSDTVQDLFGRTFAEYNDVEDQFDAWTRDRR